MRQQTTAQPTLDERPTIILDCTSITRAQDKKMFDKEAADRPKVGALEAQTNKWASCLAPKTSLFEVYHNQPQVRGDRLSDTEEGYALSNVGEHSEALSMLGVASIQNLTADTFSVAAKLRETCEDLRKGRVDSLTLMVGSPEGVHLQVQEVRENKPRPAVGTTSGWGVTRSTVITIVTSVIGALAAAVSRLLENKAISISAFITFLASLLVLAVRFGCSLLDWWRNVDTHDIYFRHLSAMATSVSTSKSFKERSLVGVYTTNDCNMAHSSRMTVRHGTITTESPLSVSLLVGVPPSSFLRWLCSPHLVLAASLGADNENASATSHLHGWRYRLFSGPQATARARTWCLRRHHVLVSHSCLPRPMYVMSPSADLCLDADRDHEPQQLVRFKVTGSWPVVPRPDLRRAEAIAPADEQAADVDADADATRWRRGSAQDPQFG